MYLILLLLWLAFSFINTISDYEDPEKKRDEAQARIDRYEKWVADNHLKRYGFTNKIVLMDRLCNNPTYQGTYYNREYLKELLGYDIDYKEAHTNLSYCEKIMQDVAEKEGWVVPPYGKTWQELEPKYWIAKWGSEPYYKWMHDHKKKPHWEYPE